MRVYPLWFATVLLIVFSTVIHAESSQHVVEYDGKTRSYLLTVPVSYSQSKPIPLLVALHGRPGTAERMASLSDFDVRAEQYGFLVVYPQGLNNYWNYLFGVENYRTPPDDVGYINRVVDLILADYNVDRERIYLAGISNGGFMAQRLSCQQPQRFAAFASVAATGYAYMPENCTESQTISALYIHGTADTKTPWRGLVLNGDNGIEQPVTLSMTESLKFWSEKNRCSSGVETSDVVATGRSPQTRVRILSSRACHEDTQVALYAVMGGWS